MSPNTARIVNVGMSQCASCLDDQSQSADCVQAVPANEAERQSETSGLGKIRERMEELRRQFEHCWLMGTDDQQKRLELVAKGFAMNLGEKIEAIFHEEQNISIPVDVLLTPIQELHLPGKVENLFLATNMKYVGDLLLNVEAISKMRKIGRESYSAINNAVCALHPDISMDREIDAKALIAFLNKRPKTADKK